MMIKQALSASLLLLAQNVLALPEGFAYLADIAPNIKQSMRYFAKENFIGRKIKGYDKPTCIVTKKTAKALKKAEFLAEKRGLSLLVYDCYRPKKAVLDFYHWSQNKDKSTKAEYYPNEHKNTLFEKGYIARHSSHSTGTTVDISLIKMRETPGLPSGNCTSMNRQSDGSLDMGTSFDCFDKKSHTYTKKIKREAYKNRALLRKIMISVGFKPYRYEWWHFSLKQADNNKAYDFNVA